MQQLIVATRNPHKTREFAALLGPDFSISDLTGRNDLPEIVETGATFEQNAVLKALAVSRALPNEWVIADDSGLQVDALGGAPGVYSARYAGESATDVENVTKLLRELQRVVPEKTAPTARFVCVLALARRGALVANFRGVAEGRIAPERRGAAGFGYDPVFVPKGYEQTFAEMSAETKNRISHRAKAAMQLREFLEIIPRA
jgi:XTP/dITP diphosphohydrolase